MSQQMSVFRYRFAVGAEAPDSSQPSRIKGLDLRIKAAELGNLGTPCEFTDAKLLNVQKAPRNVHFPVQIQ